MHIFRIEDDNSDGPFRGEAAVQMSRADERRLLEIVKGKEPLFGERPKYLTCSPAPKHELILAEKKRDVAMMLHHVEYGATCKPTIDRGNRKTDMIFGCASKEALDSWFSMTPELAALLRKYGFKEAVYDVPDDKVMKFYTQVGFQRRHAELLLRQEFPGAP